MKRITLSILLLLAFMLTLGAQENKNIQKMEHYTFTLNENVNRTTVSFKNRFGIQLTANVYMPKDMDKSKKYAAIAIGGPFGAVKEQASGFYANELASHGFVTLAFDPSFTGESGGEPRYMASADINTEDFSAAVDYLATRPYIDAERIGIIGICGWGGMAINAAALDTRIKATVASTMYNIPQIRANGYFDKEDSKEKRMEKRRALNAQRTKDFESGTYALGGGVVDPLPANAPQFVVDYHDYYKTPRGYHERSLNSNGGWAVTAALSLMNAPILTYADEIESAVLLIHGEKAHSLYFSESAFKKLHGDNKELMIIPGASHVDLYDNKAMIPFDKLVLFFNKNLK